MIYETKQKLLKNKIMEIKAIMQDLPTRPYQ